MDFLSLQSGSNGNCVYVEAAGVRLFFDAGISGAQAKERLAVHGRRPEDVDALFITHDHADHVRCAGVFSRKFELPVYITPRTYSVTKRRGGLVDGAEICHFRAGASVKIGAVTVHSIATPHDAVDGVVYIVDDGKHKLGICTDLGHVYADLADLVATVDGLYLESNYDEKMLAEGSYHPQLKRRISGPGGHISNMEAAELIGRHGGAHLQWICLAHLSEENNTPQLAMAAHKAVLSDTYPLHLASRYGVSELLSIKDTAAPAEAPAPPAFELMREVHRLSF